MPRSAAVRIEPPEDMQGNSAQEGNMALRALSLVGLLTIGCASPEMTLRQDIYMDAARACDAQFPSVQMARVGMEGSLSVDVEAGQTQDVPAFARCYWQGIAQRVEHRRQAGLPLPDPFDLKPSVDIAPEQGR
jgi:hypothetical protein